MNVKAEITDSTLSLIGPLTEDVNLESLAGWDGSGVFKIDLKNVTWTNSIGVIKLRDFVSGKVRGPFEFVNCPLDFIFQLQTVPGLLAGGRGKVGSVLLPFECSECDTENLDTVSFEMLLKLNKSGESPNKVCPCRKKCMMEYMGSINFNF